ncbi:beta-galactosidase [Phaeacidiphilus oryzae]|uniref:beta-galactosidase n=1 Tax=Phaeacidiphilus oryzae TaxID=348818 RepID=UPI0005609922|nr:beta-galactosidase [Phaeacidiphilus oryzae]
MPGFWYGGDYSPEQWPPAVWEEDDALMRQAGVNTATVGVFAWSTLEPAEGTYDFTWLDRTLDRLHANGVRVILATPTASPPPWFSLAHPDALPVTPEGTQRWHGSRDTYCAAAPAYREAAKRVTAALGERYAEHPAVAMWHVHNEYGTPCYCEHVAAAFRCWLRARYDGDLAALNDAWYTRFWSQGYRTWDEILPPRDTQYLPNPAHAVDFARFWSDELLAAYREQRDILRGHTPDTPITTNFMLPDGYQMLDFWRWSAEVDVVAIDHYLNATGVAGTIDVAFGADRARSFNRNRPWLLMEQAVSTMWPGHGEMVTAKEPGRLLRDSLAYVARGSDSVLAFQWRASRGGSELHHAAMVPHAGADTRVFREVAALGRTLSGLDEIVGSTVRASVAILWDADTRWALELPVTPSRHLRYVPALRDTHAALWRAGAVADFARYEDDLSRYAVVFAPSAYLLSPAAAKSLASYVEGGGHLVLGCFSGVVDERYQAWLGGFPGGLLEALGVRVEEFHPLAPGQTVALTDGATGQLWSEDLATHGAEVLAGYRGGVLDGKPAITRHTHGEGTGWYVSTFLNEGSTDRLVRRVLDAAGVRPELPGAPEGVEAVRRHGSDGRSWLFLFNHTDNTATVPAHGRELLTGAHIEGALRLAPLEVAVIRETRPPEVN